LCVFRETWGLPIAVAVSICRAVAAALSGFAFRRGFVVHLVCHLLVGGAGAGRDAAVWL